MRLVAACTGELAADADEGDQPPVKSPGRVSVL